MIPVEDIIANVKAGITPLPPAQTDDIRFVAAKMPDLKAAVRCSEVLTARLNGLRPAEGP